MNAEGLADIMNQQDSQTLAMGAAWPNKYPLRCRCGREMGVSSQFLDPKHRSSDWVALCGLCSENAAAAELVRVQERLVSGMKATLKALEDQPLPQLQLSEGKIFKRMRSHIDPAKFYEYFALYRILSGDQW